MADIEGAAEKFGFGCFSAGFGLAFGLSLIALCGYGISGCLRDRSEAIEKENVQATTKHKEDKLKEFALVEAPSLWQTLLRLKAELKVREGREQKLRATLVEFGRNPEQDNDYMAIASIKEDMNHSLEKIVQRLEDAYLSACKFQATPSNEEYNGKMRQALTEGLQEAETVEKKYDLLRSLKQCDKDG